MRGLKLVDWLGQNSASSGRDGWFNGETRKWHFLWVTFMPKSNEGNSYCDDCSCLAC